MLFQLIYTLLTIKVLVRPYAPMPTSTQIFNLIYQSIRPESMLSSTQVSGPFSFIQLTRRRRQTYTVTGQYARQLPHSSRAKGIPFVSPGRKALRNRSNAKQAPKEKRGAKKMPPQRPKRTPKTPTCWRTCAPIFSNNVPSLAGSDGSNSGQERNGMADDR